MLFPYFGSSSAGWNRFWMLRAHTVQAEADSFMPHCLHSYAFSLTRDKNPNLPNMHSKPPSAGNLGLGERCRARVKCWVKKPRAPFWENVITHLGSPTVCVALACQRDAEQQKCAKELRGRWGQGEERGGRGAYRSLGMDGSSASGEGKPVELFSCPEQTGTVPPPVARCHSQGVTALSTAQELLCASSDLESGRK